MKKEYIRTLSLLLVAFNGLLFSQKQEFCHEGPLGIFVSGGKQLPNGVKLNKVIIERKENDGEWKMLKELSSPTTEAEFKAKFMEALVYFPDFEAPDEKKLSAIWGKTKYSVSDSLGYWGLHPAVKIALGLMYYDKDVKSNISYSYKLILGDKSYESRLYGLPFNPSFDELHFMESWYNNDGLNLKWFSVGQHPAVGLKVFTYDEKRKPIEVKTDVWHYKKKDTSFYSVIHKGIKPGVDGQYSVVGIDRYENASLTAAQAVISSLNFQSIYFTYTKALREKNNLGISLHFKTNTSKNITSIRLFKSADGGKTFDELSRIMNTDTMYSDENVQPDKIYYYYFIAFSNDVQVAKSNTIFSYGLDQRQPISPVVNYAKGIANGIELQFVCSDEFLKSYRVHRKGSDEVDYKVIYETSPPDFNKPLIYKDTAQELSPKRFYSYYITVVSTSGIESDSSNKFIERPLKNTFPNTSAFFNAYYQDSTINLDWEDLRANDWTVRGYRILKRKKGETKYTLLFSNDSILECNRYKDLNFEYGKTYEYALETVDYFNNTSKEKVITSVTIIPSAVISPGGLKAINTPDAVILEWEGLQETGIKNYIVYRYQRGQKPSKLSTLSTVDLSYTDKSAKSGQLYFYYVTAVNNKNVESAGSEEVGVRK